MFATTQYWRYMFPAFPVAAAVIKGLLIRIPQEEYFVEELVARRIVIIGCIVLNYYFFPGVVWFFSVAPQASYTERASR